MAPKLRKSYTVAEKLRIVEQAKQLYECGYSKAEASKQLGVHHKQIGDWEKKMTSLKLSKKTTKHMYFYRKSIFSHIEEELMGCFFCMRERGVQMCYQHMVAHAKHCDASLTNYSDKCLYEAMRRMLKANCIRIRAVTRTAQGRPQDFDDAALDFLQVVRPIVEKVDRDSIINMDQTAIFGVMCGKYTLALHGAKSVSGRLTDHKVNSK